MYKRLLTVFISHQKQYIMDDLYKQFAAEATQISTDVIPVRHEALEDAIATKTGHMRSEAIARSYPQDEDWNKDALAEKQVGMNRAVAGIACTGSLIIDLTAKSHLISLLPAHYYAVLYASTLFKDVMAWLEHENKPESWLIMSGPSKTADIEQTLVYGAHGPASLTVFYVEDK